MALLVSPHVSAEVFLRVSAGHGVIDVDVVDHVKHADSMSIQPAKYSWGLLGFGPVGQLALGGGQKTWTTGALLEAAYFRGQSSGDLIALRPLNVAVDSRLFTTFVGPMVEVRRRADAASLGVALGFTGFYTGFEGGWASSVVSETRPHLFWGNALGLKLWVANDFGLEVGTSLRLGWHLGLNLATGIVHNFLFHPEDVLSATSVVWQMDLTYP